MIVNLEDIRINKMQYNSNQRDAIESDFNNINDQINKLKLKLNPLEKTMRVFRFIDEFDLKSHLDHVTNINISNEYNEVSTGEYNLSQIGEFKFSYDYINNNKTINVNFTIDFSSQTSYENRYEPYIECEYKLDVTNTDDEYYIDGGDYPEILIVNSEYVNGDENLPNVPESWCNLINRVINYIEGDKNQMKDLMKF